MPKNEEFLRAFFTDCQNEMRWRREVEYKLLGAIVPLHTALIAGLLVLSPLVTNEAIIIASFALVGFLWLIYFIYNKKVKAEHAIYAGLGLVVVRIWEYFSCFEEGAYSASGPLLPSSSKEYGQGLGYRISLAVLRDITIGTTVILLGIGAAAAFGYLRSR